MFIKIIQRALLLGVIATGANQAYAITEAATDMNSVFSASGSSRSITGLEIFETTANKTVTSATLTPSSSFAVAHIIESTQTLAFDGCTFSDGLQLSLKNTGSGTITFSGAASTFAMTATEASIVANSTVGIIFNTAPTFTGNGWIDVVESQTWTIGANMTLSVPVRIATGKTLTIATAGFSLTLDQLVSGLGALTHSGTGSLVFAVAPTFSGNYTQSTAAGITRLNNGVNFTQNIVLGAGSSLAVTTGGTATASGVISGAFVLTKLNDAGVSDNSTLILTGNNTFTGGLTHNGGVVSIGHNNALGTGASTLGGAATFGFNSSGLSVSNNISNVTHALTLDAGAGITGTFTGVLSGTGVNTKTGAGTVVLNGTNTNSGGFVMNGGVVKTSNANGLGANATAVTVAAASTFGYLSSVTTHASTTFALNAPLTVDAPLGVTGTLAGIVSGSSSLVKTGDGGLTISGVNTYTGGTTVNAGVVTKGATTSLGTGPLTMAPVATGIVRPQVILNAAAQTITALSANTTLAIF